MPSADDGAVKVYQVSQSEEPKKWPFMNDVRNQGSALLSTWSSISANFRAVQMSNLAPPTGFWALPLLRRRPQTSQRGSPNFPTTLKFAEMLLQVDNNADPCTKPSSFTDNGANADLLLERRYPI